jgi:hypothetical protein
MNNPMKTREKVVGAKGFEPSTSWSRTRRASQAALRPDCYTRMPHCKPSRTFRLSQLRAPKLQRTFLKQSFPAFRVRDLFSILRPFPPASALQNGLRNKKKTAGKSELPGGLNSPSV